MEKLDAFQRRFRVTAFVFAVQKKYSDDRGGNLAALVTYYGFLSVFPLLLATFTIAAYVFAGDPKAIATLENHLGSYPILGPAVAQLKGEHLQGSPIAIAAGVLGLIWGAMGLAQTMQFAMFEAWNVANNTRPGFGPRLIRGIGWYVMFGIGVLLSTFVASLGAAFHWPGGTVVSSLLALVLNLAIFTGSFWVLTPPKHARLRQLLPGAIVAGTVWTILTGVGIGLAHRLAHSNELYGTFAPVLGLLALIYLAARITIYAIEANVVAAERLWPRSLTGKDLSAADRHQYTHLVEREQRAPDESVSVSF